jgi:hypothetical protein
VSVAQAYRDDRYYEELSRLNDDLAIACRDQGGPAGGSTFLVTLPGRGLEGAWPRS